NGILVNANSMTTRNGSTTYTVGANLGTFVGSLFIDGSAGQVSNHMSYGQSRKWGVWNNYNRRQIIQKCGDGTTSWNYTTATYRAANNNSANSISVFQGVADGMVDVSLHAAGDNSSTNVPLRAAVGWNSTSTPSGMISTILSSGIGNIRIGLN